MVDTLSNFCVCTSNWGILFSISKYSKIYCFGAKYSFICKEISQSLKDKELYFVGIDIIGDYITEINVTSPTGIREIKSYDSVAIEEIFWNFIENKLSF